MGTRPIIHKYPLDRTGRHPDNLILGEPHVLPSGINRPIVTNYGAYFTESLVVRDAGTGTILTPREQYVAAQLYQDATAYTGKEVCSVIVITDLTVSSEVEVDYQVIGGEYTTSVRAMRELIHDLDLDNRPVAWGRILGKPKGYPSGPHLHDAGDLYGMEYLVEAIERIRHAILVGNDDTLQELYQLIYGIESALLAKIYRTATTQEALSGARDDLIITPKTLYGVLATFFTDEDLLARHLSAVNPHDINPSTFGLAWDRGTTLITVKGAADLL